MELSPSVYERTKYCSLECLNFRVEKACQTCGKIMQVKPSRAERTKFCSRECAKKGWAGKSRSPETQFYKGMRGTRWNGGIAHSRGYRLLRRPEHERASPNGYVSEHILVWEQVNGRPLPQDWCVHHLNGIKDDNRPENLVGMPRKNHHPALDPGYIKERVRQLEKELAELQEKYDQLLHERANT